MTGAGTNTEQVRTEGPSQDRELKTLLENHTVIKPVQVKNGVLKLDSNKKMMKFQRAVDYQNTEELDRETYSNSHVELNNIVMVRETDPGFYDLYIAPEDEDEHYKKFTFWPERQKLKTEFSEVKISLTDEQAEDLEAWIDSKIED